VIDVCTLRSRIFTIDALITKIVRQNIGIKELRAAFALHPEKYGEETNLVRRSAGATVASPAIKPAATSTGCERLSANTARIRKTARSAGNVTEAVTADATSFQGWSRNVPDPFTNSGNAAFAFCAWDGGRLPTEAEWNYAAAGGNEQRQYPWGSAAPDTAHAEHDEPDDERQHGSNGRGDRQRPQERHLVVRRERGRRIDARAEERAVSEREVARVAGQDVPRRGEHDPVEDEIEEGLVERRQAGERHHGQRRRDDHERDDCPDHVFPGRRSKSRISSVNETTGAHAGAVTAIVIASLTPITMPAASGPSARPGPPIMTTAKITPIHA